MKDGVFDDLTSLAVCVFVVAVTQRITVVNEAIPIFTDTVGRSVCRYIPTSVYRSVSGVGKQP